MRIVKENSFKRGLNNIGVEARDEATLDLLVAKINALGWINEWTNSCVDCDYGFSTDYAIQCDEFDSFKTAYKQAKKQVLAEFAIEIDSPSCGL